MTDTHKTKKSQDKITVEPGADKRLANILKRALNTPPKHQSSADPKAKPAKRKG